MVSHQVFKITLIICLKIVYTFIRNSNSFLKYNWLDLVLFDVQGLIMAHIVFFLQNKVISASGKWKSNIKGIWRLMFASIMHEVMAGFKACSKRLSLTVVLYSLKPCMTQTKYGFKVFTWLSYFFCLTNILRLWCHDHSLKYSFLG